MSKAMFEPIKEELKLLEEGLLDSVSSDKDIINEIASHVVRAGGKRLRPALSLLSAKAGKNYSAKKVLPLAVSLELIHTATLAHDDVIDGAGTRRGAATLNTKWGNQIAILGGDFLFARAFAMVAKQSYAPYVNYRISELIANLCEGEILQDHSAHVALKDYNVYYERIKNKTADFLEVATELGGFVSGVTKEEQEGMRRFGHAIGMAFQVTDDILDLEKTEEELGKPAAHDLVCGIVTLPVIYTLKESKRAGELAAIVTDEHMTLEMEDRAIEIVRESGGIDFAKSEVKRFLDDARNSIPATIPNDVRDSFLMVADFIASRSF